MNTHLPSHHIEVSIVIPAYNEGNNIPVMIEESISILDASPLRGRYELLLINDGSTDDSITICDQMTERYPFVRVFHHARNLGLGAALRTGYAESHGKYVSFCPADGEVKADQVLYLYQQVGDATLITSERGKYTQVSGVRRRPWYRGVFSKGFQLLSVLFVGSFPTRLTGIYMVLGDFVRSLPLHSNTALVSLEVLLHCQKHQVKLRHVTTEISPRISGKSKVATFSGIVRQFRDMLTFRIRHWMQRNSTRAVQMPETLHRKAG